MVQLKDITLPSVDLEFAEQTQGRVISGEKALWLAVTLQTRLLVERLEIVSDLATVNKFQPYGGLNTERL